MPKPNGQRPGRPHLKRDNQQYLYDYLVQTTGRPFHWQSENRTLPKSIRSHDMTSKQFGLQGRKVEALAKAELAAGHRHTAAELYFQAAYSYFRGQHAIFENNEEKLYIYAQGQRCYEQVVALTDYRIERIEIPWNGVMVSGWLHLNPHATKAPLLFYCDGCDRTCELSHPEFKDVHERGMHVFTFDGPGMGRSNIRGIRLTSDNYEQAASAALDHLLERPDVDGDKIALYGTGGGSLWAMQFAAHDRRLKAIATCSTYADLYFLMTEDGPRWKQLFAYLTQSPNEEELDRVLAGMTLDGRMKDISAPILMLTGEYDLRDPLEEVYRLFDQLKVPGELWVFADQFHMMSFLGGSEVKHMLMLDWLKDRLDGKPVPHPGEALYLEPGNDGPHSAKVTRKRRWFEPAAR